MKKTWRNKWFILAMVVILFGMASGAKVMAAGTDAQLTGVLTAGLNGLKAYFDWLLEVFKVIW